MRTKLLCGLAFLLCGLAFLGGTDAARAQSWPGYASGGYAGYGPAYQMNPAPSWYGGYGQGTGQAGYSPYYRGYTSYPNYYSAPNYNTSAPGYTATPYPQGPSATPMLPSGAGTTEAALPPPLDENAAAAELHNAVTPVVPEHKDRFWVWAGYEAALMQPWRLTTPLVTTSTQPTIPQAGALGAPGTGILFRNTVDFNRMDGVRLEGGYFVDDERRLSVEWIGQYILPSTVHFAAQSDANGNPLIARPVFNDVSGMEDRYLDSIDRPTVPLAGGVAIEAKSEMFSTEFNTRYDFSPGGRFHWDGLLGARYVRLNESLNIQDNVSPLSGGLSFPGSAGVPVGATLTDADSFRTTDQFYGLQLGGRVRWEGDWVFVSAFGKVAAGATDEKVDINGSSSLIIPGSAPLVAQGGILALPSNIGKHTQTVFGVMPEGGLNVGVKITPHLQLTAGYSFMWWNQVVRPGAQIDRNVNPTLVPTDSTFGMGGGTTRPIFTFNEESFWVHTLNFGVDFHY